MKTFILIIFLILTGRSVFAATTSPKDVLQLHFHGGNVISYVDEQLTIQTDGVATLSTHSPFLNNSQSNAIGTFEAKLDLSLIKSFRDEAARLFQLRDKKYLELHDSVIGELTVLGQEKTKAFIWNFEDVEKAKVLETSFRLIKEALISHPKSAITGSCKRSGEILTCSYENIGSESVSTVDPLGVTGSLACIGKDDQRRVLNAGAVNDPKQMKPKRVTIKPHEKFEFEFNDKSACKDRVVIKTTDLMLNSAYEKSLLGELNAQ